MSNIKHGCWWVLANGNNCGAPVDYRIAKDDDGNSYRKYAPYCVTHARAAANMNTIWSEKDEQEMADQ